MSIVNPGKFAKDNMTGIQEKDIQQAGIDIRINAIYKLNPDSPVRINESKRMLPERMLVKPVDGEYILYPGRFYEFTSAATVKMPSNVSGVIIGRSTFFRAGVFVTSALWDPGFCGGLNGFLYSTTNLLAIGEHERVGQFVLFDTDAYKLYNGIYQNTKGTTDIQK